MIYSVCVIAPKASFSRFTRV